MHLELRKKRLGLKFSLQIRNTTTARLNKEKITVKLNRLLYINGEKNYLKKKNTQHLWDKSSEKKHFRNGRKQEIKANIPLILFLLPTKLISLKVFRFALDFRSELWTKNIYF